MAVLIFLVLFITPVQAFEDFDDYEEELIVYEFGNSDEELLEVVEPCPVQCPNESVGQEGSYNFEDTYNHDAAPYYRQDPQQNDQVNYLIQNSLPFISDPIVRQLLKTQLMY
jgi:hypothetical protein